MKKPENLWHPMPLYDKKNKILVDWSAKGGSVLIMSMFFEHMGILSEAHKYGKWIHNYRCDIFQGKNKKKNYPSRPGTILSKHTYKIKITRNPFTRAVSSYCHTMNTKLRNKYSLGTQASFIDFLKYISPPHPRNDIHWKPQIRPIEKIQKGFFNKVCKLENLSEDIESINEELGTTFDFESQIGKTVHPHHTPRKSHNWLESLDLKHVANILWEEFDATNTPDYKYFYNQESYDLVSKIYAEDIEAYNYSYEEIESWEEFNERLGGSERNNDERG